MDFPVPTEHRMKEKEDKKLDKYLDLARELRKLWNMEVTVITIVVRTHETIPESLEKILNEPSRP